MSKKLLMNNIHSSEESFANCIIGTKIPGMSDVIYSGFKEIDKLEMSVDDGKTWTSITQTDSEKFIIRPVDGMNIDLNQMFYNCTSLISLDLSNFNCDLLKNMFGAFYNCSSLISLNLSNFNTSNVISLRYTFRGCASLTSLDLSGFDTSKVTTMEHTFKGCKSLTSLDLSCFDTSKVTNMNDMFGDNISLISVDLSNFTIGDSTSNTNMFSKCSSLASLDLSNVNTLDECNRIANEVPSRVGQDAGTYSSKFDIESLNEKNYIKL